MEPQKSPLEKETYLQTFHVPYQFLGVSIQLKTNLLNLSIWKIPSPVESEGEGSVDVLFLAPYVGTRRARLWRFFLWEGSGVEKFDWPQEKNNKVQQNIWVHLEPDEMYQ